MGYPHFSDDCDEYHDRVIDFGSALARVKFDKQIITLCGSTRFMDAFISEQRRLSLEGNIVISVGLFGHSGDLTPEETEIGHPVKDALDQLHFRKIDLSDRIHVIDVDGYVGASTSNEIAYAKRRGRQITYMSQEKP